MKLKTATLIAAYGCILLILTQVMHIVFSIASGYFTPAMLLMPILSMLGFAGLACFLFTLYKNQK